MLAPEAFSMLFDVQRLGQLTHLDLSQSTWASSALPSIHDACFANTLTHLSVQGLRLRDQQAAALVAPGTWPALEGVVLDHSLVGVQTIEALVSDPVRRATLRDLSLGFGAVDDRAVATLANAVMERVETLKLTHSPKVTQLGAQALARAAWPALRALNVSGARLGSPGLEVLLDATFAPQLEVLGLDATALGDAGMAALCERDMPALNNLQLRKNGLGDASLHALGRAPFAAALTSLRLVKNQFSDDAYGALSACQALSALKIDGVGAEVWQHLGAFTSLRELIVDPTPNLGDAGVEALAFHLRAPLRKLALWDARLSVDGIRHLLDAPALAQLEELVLFYNPIGEAGARLLADEAAERWPRLVRLYAQRKDVGDDGAAWLRASPLATQCEITLT